MDINWKVVAQSKGYRSLKAAYTHDVMEAARCKNPIRKKAEFLKLFQWVICRAQHYAVRLNQPIEHVLDAWEAKRNYWWLNYYGDSRQPKLPSGKARNVRPMRPDTYVKQDRWCREPQLRFARLRRLRHERAVTARREKNKEDRWTKERKQRQANYRKFMPKNL